MNELKINKNIKRIKKRTKEERTMLGKMKRNNNLEKLLNTCFEKKSIDEDDQETILKWACGFIPNKNLFYLFEKIKFIRLK